MLQASMLLLSSPFLSFSWIFEIMAPYRRFVYPILAVAIAWLWWNPNPPIEEIGFCGAFLAALIWGLVKMYGCTDYEVWRFWFYCLIIFFIWVVRLSLQKDRAEYASYVWFFGLWFVAMVSLLVENSKDDTAVIIPVLLYEAPPILAISLLIYNIAI